MVCRRGKDGALVFEDDVIAAEGPAVIAGIEMVAEGEDAPCQRIVNAGEWRL